MPQDRNAPAVHPLVKAMTEDDVIWVGDPPRPVPASEHYAEMIEELAAAIETPED